MSSMIITDSDSLHTVSTSAVMVDGQTSVDTQKIIRELISTIPENAAGLSAPQINFFKRVFIANFPDGAYVFVNPIVTPTGSQTVSLEGCLSIPGVQRKVLRSSLVEVSADVIYKVNNDYKHVADSAPHFGDLVEEIPNRMRLSDLPSYIVQHEYDHLEGVLITDHEEFVSYSEEVIRKIQDRQSRIHQNRLLKKNKPKKAVRLNPKKEAKLDKSMKQADKRRRTLLEKHLELQERQRAIEAGTLKSE